MKYVLFLLSSIIVCCFSFGLTAYSCVTDNEEDWSVIPVEQGAIQNAGCGTEIWHGGPFDGVTQLVNYAVRVSDYSVNSMIRPSWLDFEKEEGIYLFSKMDRNFQNCIKYGQKIDLACFITTAGSSMEVDHAKMSYPLYVHKEMQKSDKKDVIYQSPYAKTPGWEPNMENDYFYNRYAALIKAFAEYLNGEITFEGKTIVRKKLVRCIEMRHFGWWGEGAWPKQLLPNNSECMIRYAKLYFDNFPDIRIVVPTNGMGYSSVYRSLEDYHFYLLTAENKAGKAGIFRDNWGDDEKRYQGIYYAANKNEKDGIKMYELLRDRWKTAPLVGEPGRWAPHGEFIPYRNLMEQVLYLHPVVIRNCNVALGEKSVTNKSGYNLNNDPPGLKNFHEAYSIMGFRYVLERPKWELKENKISISLNWLNIGLTPTYDRWTIRFFVRDANGKEIWSVDSSLDLRTICPDESLIPGKIDFKKGIRHIDLYQCQDIHGQDIHGTLYLQIIDPDGISPPLALSNKGRLNDGSYKLGILP